MLNFSSVLMGKTRCAGLRTIAALCLSLMLLSGQSQAATVQELRDKISQLQATVNALKATTDVELSQAVEVINAINVVVAKPQTLTVGTVEVRTAAIVDLPVYYKVSGSSVAALQFDVMVSSGLNVTSVVAGTAALSAGKGVQGNPIAGGYRVVMFGLNQTAIGSGPVAVLRIAADSSALIGKRPVPISNISASNPAGISVTVTGKNGSITVR